jgi:hypothetical protein
MTTRKDKFQMAKVILVRNIQSVKLMIGRIIVTTGSGKQHSYPYERLTAAQETKLRSMAAPLPMRQPKPSRSRSASKPRKTFNYAEQIARMDTVSGLCVSCQFGNHCGSCPCCRGRSILVNVGGEFAGVLEA